MFKTLDEYQKSYLQAQFAFCQTDEYYYTMSDDKQYMNGNTIYAKEATSELVASLCILLSAGITPAKIQFKGRFPYADEQTTNYLLVNTGTYNRPKIDVQIELVTADNFSQFNQLSSELQIQEFGSEYKTNQIAQYLEQDEYQYWLIKYNESYIGEFQFFPKLSAVESVIILKEYQRIGVMSSCLSKIGNLSDQIFVSADDNSLNFYLKNNFQIIDQQIVSEIYGSPNHLLTFLSLVNI